MPRTSRVVLTKILLLGLVRLAGPLRASWIAGQGCVSGSGEEGGPPLTGDTV